MEAEILRGAKIREAKGIWKQAFGDDDGFIDGYFKRRVPKGHVLGLSADEKLMSMLCTVPMRFKIRGGLIPAALITGVATRPEMRGKGHMAALFEAALPKLRAMGFLMSYLHPEVLGFYEKFGYGYTASCTRCVITRDMLPVMNMKKSMLLEGSRAEKGAQDVYWQAFNRNPCILQRRKKDWRFIMDDVKGDGGGCVLGIDEKSAKAYAVWHGSSGEAKITEAAWEDGDILMDVLQRIFENARTERIDAVLPMKAVELFPTAQIQDFGMSRVIDMQALMQRMRVSADVRIKMKVGIYDGLLRWNDGVFQLVCSNGRAAIRRVEGRAAFECGIEGWAQLLCGYAKPSELIGKGKAAENEHGAAEVLDKIFPKKPCTCFETY
ncbi:MAG: GNAT family N-acetyltransferase [Bacillota bacterium]|nr:GNAT family N-acetyltransferase [Bacillota bacterium]